MTLYEREQSFIINEILSPAEPVKVAFSGATLTVGQIRDLQLLLEKNGFSLCTYNYPVFVYVKFCEGV